MHGGQSPLVSAQHLRTPGYALHQTLLLSAPVTVLQHQHSVLRSHTLPAAQPASRIIPDKQALAE